MKRAEVNFILNALLFLSLAIITGIGFLIKYTLLPGSERRAVYGDNVDLLYWGMDRHEWGEIHLIAGFVFLGLTALHIILHWKVVVNVYHRIIQWKPLNLIVALVFAAICSLIIFLPLLTEPEVVRGGHEHGKRQTSTADIRGQVNKGCTDIRNTTYHYLEQPLIQKIVYKTL